MIPLAVPHLAGREAEYLQECVTSTFVSSVGPFVERFEREVAAAAGVAGAVAVTSGTAALHLALRTAGVSETDLVALPSYTFVASANAVAYCGASPWLFDVTDTSWTLDPEQLARTLKQRLTPGPDGPVDRVSGRRLGAVMPVHTLGHPADMAPIVEVAAAYDVPVVADAAAALGATYRGEPVGRLGAQLTAFSFNGNKTITAGGGGALVSDDESLLECARHLSTTARSGPDYDHDEIGYNYRLTNVQAAVGCAQVEQLARFVATKRRIRQFYEQRLGDLSSLQHFPVAAWADSACWFSGVATDEAEQLRGQLRAAGVDARPFWKPMHLQRPFTTAPREPLSLTDSLWRRVLPLPCSTGITDEELEQVVAAVRGSVRS